MAAELTIIDRFRRMPRAIQWLAAAGGIAIVALVYLDMQELRGRWDKQARSIEDRVTTVRKGIGPTPAPLEETIASVGAIDLPTDEGTGGEALARIVNELSNQYRLGTSANFQIRPDRKLPADVLPQLGRLGTIKCDFAFESSPEDATAIIAKLESDPAVECVRSMRMNKSGSRKVKVRLVLEAWVTSTASGPARSRGTA
jgi:hypothetical protein